MRTVQDYIFLARKNNQIYSNSKLANTLGITSGAFSQIFKEKTTPSDETIIKLAELAGIPKNIALLEASIWRCKSPEIQKIWLDIYKCIVKE